MRVLPEELTARLVTEEMALSAAKAAFRATADGEVFPVVVARTPASENRFTLKSGATTEAAGIKIGSYWPSNTARGLPRHSSTIVLLDTATGRVAAVVEAAAANAYRTAAADALAVSLLARPDARVLTIFGTGHQAFHEVRAVVRVRDFEQILVVGRRPEAADEFAAEISRTMRLPADAVGAEQGCVSADVVVTATTAVAPLFENAWITPGTHVSAMGADAPGKQELPPMLLGRAQLFCDLRDQARVIGELQHSPAVAELTQLGDVLAGRAPGRITADAITVFDSSGIVLQDLELARALLAAADPAP